jgi:mono/diheme cytochrome c family protein
MRSRSVPLLKTVATVAVALVLPGCDWFSTMSRTDAIQPYESEPLRPPEHAVPLDGLPEFDLTTVEGLLANPVPADSASRARGEAWFLTYCAVCHGADGMGKGPIADKFPAIPTLAGVVRFSDAYIFAMISQGRGLMPAYGRIPKRARWDIINHLRSMTFGAGTPVGAGADTTASAAAPAGTPAPPTVPAAPDTGASRP